MNDKLELKWITNRRIADGQYPIHGIYRVDPYTEDDSGWRAISEADDEEYLNDMANVVSLTEQEIFVLEPALEQVKNLPAGTELELIQEETGVRFVDYETKEPIKL